MTSVRARTTALLIGQVVAVVSSACVADVQVDAAPSIDSRATARVTDVIDGDTIRAIVDGEEITVRLIGIDTPEKDGPYTDLECYGQEATAYARERLRSQDVTLEFDVERADRFDRTLAYVWLGEELVNESILAEGAGVLLTIPPNVSYVERFERAQREAREAERGLWGACP